MIYKLYSNKIKLSDSQYDWKQCTEYDFKLNNLESILKKCQNIETIIISNNLFDAKSWSQTIRLVITYCRHLVSINCRFDKLSESLFKQFVDKFGYNLMSYESYSINDWKYLK